jgi:hypothetical protein
MLLAHLAPAVDLDEFALELQRAKDFAEDLDHESATADPRLTSQVMLASLRASFAQGLTQQTMNGDLNRRIGGSILQAFREEIFETSGLTTGLAPTLWLERLARTANEAEGMVEELMLLDLG